MDTMPEKQTAAKKASRADKEITLVVYVPREDEPKTFTFDKTTKVGAAAQEIAQAFGYDGEGFTLQRGDKVLDSKKPLMAEGLSDGDELDLVGTGGGV